MSDQTNIPFCSPTLLPPVFFRVFTVVFLVVLMTSVAITFILPESYASTCRIKVQSAADMSGGKTPYEPYFLQTTFEVIQSQLVLDPVIAKLNLNVEWGKKYFNGQTLKASEAREILKARTSLAPVRGTKLIAITVYSDDRNEAARLANAIADSYWAYRVVGAGKANASSQLSPPMHSDKFGTAGHEQDALEKTFPVLIFNRAEPGRYPVKPNKPLNIIIGAVAGAFVGLVVGGASALVAAKLENRGRNAAVSA
ncbi:MAG: Wzz/FepE/Etk N-terminal domain-containing protein [Verrucomicrobiota bacterium]